MPNHALVAFPLALKRSLGHHIALCSTPQEYGAELRHAIYEPEDTEGNQVL